MWVYVHVGLYN